MVSGIAAVSVPGTPGISGQQPLQQGSLLCGPSAYDTRQRFRRVCVPRKRYVKGEHQSVCGKAWADSCQPLLDAGTNWYDAKAEIDFLLEEENRFSLRITPLNGGEIRDVEIALTGLPQRPARTTRIHLQIDMADLTTLRLNMEDFGFGEFFPATHQFWEKTISIGEKEKETAPTTSTTASAAMQLSVSE